ncbi:hypothetical protein TVAG_108420 [Trichomonas vaginalis G3]|uniref:Exostosin GT47 domain-containing protein n=1 Tax=Trichomonas vaginalis (strain ATCC PRA-98 / G3) TaxID=412133 RepID=A2EQG6_TRIV3|nr:exostosin family [Trichomonas vaginalis G3]EAY05108.1 hypothetical protein TVAG_108420 [Trichomonas vaginalis G3]KAI5551462.1 exostosin family [Trichomonas vaginalis G3]|eukprot:XP_001317331.1 hypothetical protein [Trichomonas vaginalis G3]
MSIFKQSTSVGNHKLKIYIEDIPSKYNKDLIQDKCSYCNCNNYHLIGLEPLIHCLIENSDFKTQSIDDATFIFVPSYTSIYRQQTDFIDIPDEIKKTNSFKIWHGSRHLIVDSSIFYGGNNNYMKFPDQHVVIATNLTIDFIHEDRWLNSRHIQVPPLQIQDSYPKNEKTKSIVFVGNSTGIIDILNSVNASILSDHDDILNSICSSNFTILRPNEIYLPQFIYEIIRCRSIPILLSGPFLPAYANTHIDYSKLSIRLEMNNISQLKTRINKFDIADGLEYNSKVYNHFFWPLNGKISKGDAADILFDYLSIRDLILTPVLRRKYIGTEEYI